MTVEDLEALAKEIDSFSISSKESLEIFHNRYLSRKGKIVVFFKSIKDIPQEERGSYGQRLNKLKQEAEIKLEKAHQERSFEEEVTLDTSDASLPGRQRYRGSTHPVQKTLSKIKRIFSNLGFNVEIGPEIETDKFNFAMLNFPANHPARDMQDTIYVKKSAQIQEEDILLRTHTSPVQVRILMKQPPPVRIIAPGKVYRNETVSSRSLCVFHQVEGLYVDTNVSFRDLKGILYSFAKHFFDINVKTRFRPSFFPFTEPSAEMDISCYLCNGSGCNICKKTGWLEILGCGMVHPNVFKKCNINDEKHSGFAFGIGVERLTLLQYHLNDIRMLYENDFRLLSQFSR